MSTKESDEIYTNISTNDPNKLIYSKQGSIDGTITLQELIKARQDKNNKQGDE